MELKQEELQTLRTAVSGGSSLDELLRTRFPHAMVTVIRGFDQFSSEPYTEGAFFFEVQARDAMAAIPPNGSLPDTYHLLTGEVRQLGSLVDQNTRRPLDGFDQQRVYAALLEQLSSPVGR